MQIRDGITFTLKQAFNFWYFEFITDNWFFGETKYYLKVVLKNCQL